MGTTLHEPDTTERPLGRGGRTPDEPGKAAGKAPAQDAQDESAIEAFEEEGAGIAAKE